MFEILAAIFIMFVLYIFLAVVSAIVRVINSVSVTQVPGQVLGCLGVLVMFYVLVAIVLPLLY